MTDSNGRQKPIVYAHHDMKQSSLIAYSTGFTVSLVSTAWTYLLATRHRLSGWSLTIGLLAMATGQFFVQLYYFLHIGHELKPRWKQLLLFMMIAVVLILVLGSIWIMYNLNYNMTQQQIHTYLHNQDGGL